MTLPDHAAVFTWRALDKRAWTASEITDLCGPRNGVYECQYADLWNRKAVRK